MSYRLFMPIMLLALISACATPLPEPPPPSNPTRELSALTLPTTVAGLALLAQSASEDQRNGLYRPALDALPSIQVSIYPLPNGWELWDKERQLMGHYGQVRLEALNQLAARGDNFSLVKEEHEPDFSQDIPVAKFQIRTATGHRVLTENHFLALYEGFYIKARYDAEINDSPLALEDGERLLGQFIRQLFATP